MFTPSKKGLYIHCLQKNYSFCVFFRIIINFFFAFRLVCPWTIYVILCYLLYKYVIPYQTLTFFILCINLTVYFFSFLIIKIFTYSILIAVYIYIYIIHIAHVKVCKLVLTRNFMLLSKQWEDLPSYVKTTCDNVLSCLLS